MKLFFYLKCIILLCTIVYASEPLFDREDVTVETPRHKVTISYFFQKNVTNNHFTVILPGRGASKLERDTSAKILVGKLKSHVVVLSYPGHEGSSPLEEDPRMCHMETMNEYHEVVAAGIKDLENRKARNALRVSENVQFNLVGHSLGGYLGMHFMQQKPSFFRNAILIAPMFQIRSPFWTPVTRFFSWCATKINARAYAPKKDPDLYPTIFENNPNCQDQQYFNEFWRPKYIAKAPTWGWFYAANEATYSLTSNLLALQHITTRCLFLCAQHDFVVDNNVTREVAAALPNQEFRIIPNAWHGGLFDTPTTRVHILTFVEQHLRN